MGGMWEKVTSIEQIEVGKTFRVLGLAGWTRTDTIYPWLEHGPTRMTPRIVRLCIERGQVEQPATEAP